MVKGVKSFFTKKKDIPITNNPTSPTINLHATMEEELERVFKKFDLNNDGKVSALELGSIMQSLGSPITKEELAEIVNHIDGDGDGCINLQEFIELNTKDVDSNEVLANLRDAFSVFDMDKNGSISAEELRSVLRSIGEDRSLSECKKMISGVDANGDGMICFEEFKVMMMKGSGFDTKN